MTDTVVEPVAAEVDQWLSRFEEALSAGDTQPPPTCSWTTATGATWWRSRGT